MTEASAGLKTSKVLLDVAGTHFPPIKFCLGFASQLVTRGLIASAGRLVGARPFPFPLMRDVFAVRALMRR
jgi:hypothetical protein